MRAIVLSVPHNGTHFTVWLLQEVLGIETEYCHMEPGHYDRIMTRLAVMTTDERIIVPVRNLDLVWQSWLARGQSALGDHFDECYKGFNRLLPWLAMKPLMFLPVDDTGDKHKLMWRLKEFLGLYGLSEGQLEFARRWPVVRSMDPETGDFRGCEIDLDRANLIVREAGQRFSKTIENR